MENTNELRKALGCFATGVAIITTSDEQFEPIGVTINSFTSLSLEPPLIMWGLSKKAPSLDAFKYRRLFGVNILSSEQEELLKIFSTPSKNKFLNVQWDMSEKKLPKIRGCIANFECVVHSIFPGGDHEIFVGNVIDYSHTDLKPLVLSKGKVISN